MSETEKANDVDIHQVTMGKLVKEFASQGSDFGVANVDGLTVLFVKGATNPVQIVTLGLDIGGAKQLAFALNSAARSIEKEQKSSIVLLS